MTAARVEIDWCTGQPLAGIPRNGDAWIAENWGWDTIRIGPDTPGYRNESWREHDGKLALYVRLYGGARLRVNPFYGGPTAGARWSYSVRPTTEPSLLLAHSDRCKTARDAMLAAQAAARHHGYRADQ